ncbi:MAG: CoA transferase, partial [Actinomycetota bacterium]|nr:CoA transferase [Actinomycetota bacterium]
MTSLHPFPPTTPAPDRPGPLAGVRVVEVAHEFCAFAGRLLADAGAELILVEPPGGAAQRTHAPFADGEPGSERSLSFWAENTSKYSVVADLDQPDGANFFHQLVDSADVLLEAEPPGRLNALGLDYDDL